MTRRLILILVLIACMPVSLAAAEKQKIRVAVLLYDGALLLDYGISAEMFLAADLMRAYQVETIATSPSVRVSILGDIEVDRVLRNSEIPDIVIVPGGPGWQQAADDPDIRQFISDVAAKGGTVLSICTGSLLLAKAGLLEGRAATTNLPAIGMLNRFDPSIKAISDQGFVRDGSWVSTVGSGTAIDATLAVIEETAGAAIARDLASRYLGYTLAQPRSE